ncbi:METHIONYL-TRNA SYNTHETASE, mitochondrial [Teratosphaeria destructans]|uniref:METHIONYL-TRNA SYNTHETASE, mitochondrial n=1 Tax=Teratosphaeria destructans TaxID=418781 RepID=A0A9W7SZ16_9PEZI|nr:METHIONYL-TRNA SYNTHETASE, mitochondrial [Teratosphaeria destructans]
MKLNTHHALTTPKILLVSYTPHHVPTYHTWMQSPSLLSATASEPLTLAQEYSMQESWRQDKDKLTFIICLPLQNTERSVRAGIDDAPERMVGDVNLFLYPAEEDEGIEGSVVGELELMIALPELRRMGYGRAALVVFMEYIWTHWGKISAEYHGHDRDHCTTPRGSGETSAMEGLQYLRVKIQESNVGSIKLFEGLGFAMMGSGANYFGEVELRMDAQKLAHLDRQNMRLLDYEECKSDSNAQ